MAPREELVASAVTFLRDPSVASSPLDKRIAFLQSKNLTQEEIDISLARASEDSSGTSSAQSQNASYYPPPQQSSHRRPPQNYPYPYNPYGEWQPQPPEVPRRDWRDWFIMATVIGGAGYGLWVLTHRYIKPLIAPPTPPQLEQDKAAIDEQFARAFALLDTLHSDTAALKEAEEVRTRRLDTTLTDVETVVAELKAANLRREDENRRMEMEIKGIRETLPRAVDSVREGSDKRLKELGRELSSLKLLMGNRFGANPVTTSSSGLGTSARQSADGSGPDTPVSENLPTVDAATAPGPAKGLGAYNPNPTAAMTQQQQPTPEQREVRARTYGAGGSQTGKASIPAWQMAALNAAEKNKTKGAGPLESAVNSSSTGGSGSGSTITNERDQVPPGAS